MAKINARDIQQNGTGNLIQVIGASSEEGKPFTQCNAEELRQEQDWRKQLLSKENRRTFLLVLRVILWLVCGGGATYVSQFWFGMSHWLTLLLAAGGVVLPGVALYILSQQGETEFALRQRAALKEIAYLLREKGEA